MGDQKVVYFRNLDALRAIAAFAVIFFHIGLLIEAPVSPFYSNLQFITSFAGQAGKLGVVFFFMLSGFLITYLMYLEQDKQGSLNIKFFYIRRALRIWPLYFVTLLVGFLLYPGLVYLSTGTYHENANWLMHALFLTNFDYLINGLPQARILAVQWSIAIEEQFYLLWPLMFVLFNRKAYFPFILLLLILLSELFYLSVDPVTVGYYHSASVFRFLAFGALLAYCCYHKIGLVQWVLDKLSPLVTFGIYAVCLVLLLFYSQLNAVSPYFRHVSHLLPFFFFGFVIVEQNFSKNSFFKLGKFSLLNWLGKISYGLYLTHVIAIYIVLAVLPAAPEYYLLKGVGAILVCVLLSYLSYRYLEAPFLSLKNDFSRIAVRPSEVLAPGVLAAAQLLNDAVSDTASAAGLISQQEPLQES